MNIKDIAALAHVSPATVSKALNNGYGVDEETAAYCFGGVTSVSYDKSIIRQVVEDLLADEQKGEFVRRTYIAKTYVAERYTG